MDIKEKNVERINSILSLYGDFNDMTSMLYHDINELYIGMPSSPIKNKIEFHQGFIGEYMKYVGTGNECILNFGSAKHAGGGVLKGSVAQEEDICRNSLLYIALSKYDDLYENAVFKGDDNYYTDFVIYTKNVPTIDDNLQIKNTNSYITSAAPNFNGVDNFDKVKYEDIMLNRMRKILRIAIENGEKNIVLGAFGCGVFKNDPILVSNYFKYLLDIYGGNFDKITFAIPDDYNMNIFKNTLI